MEPIIYPVLRSYCKSCCLWTKVTKLSWPVVFLVAGVWNSLTVFSSQLTVCVYKWHSGEFLKLHKWSEIKTQLPRLYRRYPMTEPIRRNNVRKQWRIEPSEQTTSSRGPGLRNWDNAADCKPRYCVSMYQREDPLSFYSLIEPHWVWQDNSESNKPPNDSWCSTPVLFFFQKSRCIQKTPTDYRDCWWSTADDAVHLCKRTMTLTKTTWETRRRKTVSDSLIIWGWDITIVSLRLKCSLEQMPHHLRQPH